ncbi:MAG: P-loop NTPase [Candidatus Aenigmarchaeota archaeon]|nr:P-loop NTPase [Candidatus Aenigmarchaeota archaeon]
MAEGDAGAEKNDYSDLEKHSHDVTGGKARVIGIVSGKGGVGKTTFAANLSIALTALGKKVVVIDCNVTTPHLSYYLGVKNFSTTINNVFSGDVDVAFAPLDQNGVMFIPASEKFTDLKNVNMQDLEKIVKKLADLERFDFIILDSAAGLGRETIGVLNACNEVLFITTPTAPNIMDVVRCNEVARMVGHSKFSIVLNMVRGKKYEITPEKAEEIFSMPVIGMVPFDENVMDATAEGVPILWYKPNSPSCMPLMQIAGHIAGVEPGAAAAVEGELVEEAESEVEVSADDAETGAEQEYDEIVVPEDTDVREIEEDANIDYSKIDINRMSRGRGKIRPMVNRKKKGKGRRDDSDTRATAGKLADRLKGLFSR